MRRHWGHACLCIIIYNYDLQGIWVSPHPIQPKMDDQYKSFKTLNTAARLTVHQPSNILFRFVDSPKIQYIECSFHSYFPEDMHTGIYIERLFCSTCG